MNDAPQTREHRVAWMIRDRSFALKYGFTGELVQLNNAREVLNLSKINEARMWVMSWSRLWKGHGTTLP